MAVENVIWPRYLDASTSRSAGRRVPLGDAVEEPTVDEIAEAVQQIGYDAVIERDVRHPQEWDARGRVVVKGADDSTKNDLVQAVAAYVGILRD
ncbi:signal recognition particle, subunit SRP19 (srp19) [Halogeometricum rufum]|jgi:signal recognition particle subunit SRP19|uniref:Signal recognition particle 19 kDa protein n=1 Tax=Halogeometricum rufum TaxID=553469 RepID=A0A1I6GJR0_9EURY|nr:MULTISPECIES: signal recognition particle subunit SRP19 [Halogeometricum]MUV58174.1 signal recognition particle protein Srp19 [Halogeometricum sp. CBA1124]SFR42381.1 signal recognition particle, subunit SRP19 (srp19) [Halogeometricum rufum]